MLLYRDTQSKDQTWSKLTKIYNFWLYPHKIASVSKISNFQINRPNHIYKCGSIHVYLKILFIIRKNGKKYNSLPSYENRKQ